MSADFFAPQLGEQLLAYLAVREQQHATAVDRVLSAMSARERALVREAAVMGYIEGVRSRPGWHKASIPRDGEVLRLVLGACLAMPDLYPTISGHVDDPGGA